jgi:hypothetical protein
MNLKYPTREPYSSVATGMAFAFLVLAGCTTTALSVAYKMKSVVDSKVSLTKASTFTILLSSDMPLEVRKLLEPRLDAAANRAHIQITDSKTADYLIVIESTWLSHPQNAEGYSLLGIKGRAYKLLNGGGNRGKYDVWECEVRGSGYEYAKVWVDPDTLLDKLFQNIGIEYNKDDI